MEISYYDNNGVQLPSPLPNPFTNTETYNQNLTVRVTNSQTGCFNETILTLETSLQPSINQPRSEERRVGKECNSRRSTYP